MTKEKKNDDRFHIKQHQQQPVKGVTKEKILQLFNKNKQLSLSAFVKLLLNE